MASVFDVAAYILSKTGSISTWKLQKLVYYSQAWHLVWDDEPLFNSEIEAWANGPVTRDLYNAHRGQFTISPGKALAGDPSQLVDNERETIDAVVNSYGRMSGYALSELTHAEDPWKQARAGLGDGAWSNAPITHAAMAEYYSAVQGTGTDVVDVEW